MSCLKGGCYHVLKCTLFSLQLTIWPGQEERLNLEGIDQFGNPTYIIVRLSDQRSGISFGAFSQAGDNQEINTTVSE